MSTSWHMTAFCGLFLLGLGFLLHVIGTATPTWVVGNENGRGVEFQYGLFRVCLSTCVEFKTDLLEDDTARVLMCIQAFVILGVIFSGIALCSAFFLIINVFCEKRNIHLEIARRSTKRISIVTATLSLCSGVFIAIGVGVFDAEFYQIRHLGKGSDIHLYTEKGDSFNLCVAGLVFIVLGGFLFCVFVNMKVPDSLNIVSRPGQTISLSPTGPQNQSTWTVSNSRELQQQWEQLRQQKQQLQRQREKLQQRKNLLQQQQQQFQNDLKKLTPEMQLSQQFLWQQQQLQKEQHHLQQKDEHLLLRQQQLRQQEEHLLVRQQQLRQQGEQLQQQQVGQQQEPQAQWHHVQSSQDNSMSQPLFTLSPPSYESLQLTPSSGASPTQFPPPSFQSPQTSVRSPPPFNETQTPPVEAPPPPYEEI